MKLTWSTSSLGFTQSPIPIILWFSVRKETLKSLSLLNISGGGSGAVCCPGVVGVRRNAGWSAPVRNWFHSWDKPKNFQLHLAAALSLPFSSGARGVLTRGKLPAEQWLSTAQGPGVYSAMKAALQLNSNTNNLHTAVSQWKLCAYIFKHLVYSFDLSFGCFVISF